MSENQQVIPVILFVYTRSVHLVRVLDCLRADRVPLLYVFSDAPKEERARPAVDEVRKIIRSIDWTRVIIVERQENLGLGRNIVSGVSEVAKAHEAFVVWEDDLVCVPGTYGWLCAALHKFKNVQDVGSVTAWTHPKITPVGTGNQPYFDGRAECWVWGSWTRAWQGMEEGTAMQKLQRARQRGIAADAYGSDLPPMAKSELRRNVWAVRWLYHHFEYNLLCLRPPWSMVEHIGFDPSATNAAAASEWENPPLRECPPIPSEWPLVIENSQCQSRWKKAARTPPLILRVWRKVFR